MINDLGEVMMMTWAKMGLKIENQIETQESLIIYISVLEFSDERNAKKNKNLCSNWYIYNFFYLPFCL